MRSTRAFIQRSGNSLVLWFPFYYIHSTIILLHIRSLFIPALNPWKVRAVFLVDALVPMTKSFHLEDSDIPLKLYNLTV
jgi:hypothetical protein